MFLRTSPPQSRPRPKGGGVPVDQVLITNNSRFRFCCTSQHHISGTSQDVFFHVRDRVHEGWKLLTHPLYGNFLPSQQPYRSFLVESPGEEPGLDVESLGLLEKALEFFREYQGRIHPPEAYVPEILKDFQVIDVWLLKDSLESYGLWKDVSWLSAPKKT